MLWSLTVNILDVCIKFCGRTVVIDAFDSDLSILLYSLEYQSSICHISVQAKSISEKRKYMAFIDLLIWYLINEI